MKIKIIGLYHFSDKEALAIKNSLQKGEGVINSNIFKLKVLYGTFSENRGFTNLEIYNLIMGGTIISGRPQGDMELDITGYRDHSSTIGWTNVHGLKTYINETFLDKFNESEVFRNILHEFMHTLGFVHRNWWAKKSSVPYRIGGMAQAAFKEFEVRPSLTGESKIQFIV